MRLIQAGFTLMELLVVIAIAAVLTGIAIPNFRTAIQSAETREAATGLYSALARARSEAIARNTPVSICARDASSLTTPACSSSNSAWKDGWIIYVDKASNPIQLHEPIANGLALGGAAATLSFDATGRIAASTTYKLCAAASAAERPGRTIVVSRSGRVSLEPPTC